MFGLQWRRNWEYEWWNSQAFVHRHGRQVVFHAVELHGVPLQVEICKAAVLLIFQVVLLAVLKKIGTIKRLRSYWKGRTYHFNAVRRCRWWWFGWPRFLYPRLLSCVSRLTRPSRAIKMAFMFLNTTKNRMNQRHNRPTTPSKTRYQQTWETELVARVCWYRVLVDVVGIFRLRFVRFLVVRVTWTPS